MKIAIRNNHGIIPKEADVKLQIFYAVADDYDFEINNATEVTSVINLSLFWDKGFMDYIKFRTSIKKNILPIFYECSEADQKTMVSHFIYPDDFTQESIDVFFTDEEQKSNWQFLVATTMEGRKARWEIARQKVSFELTELESLQFYYDVKRYKDDYLDANLPHLVLWLSSGAYPDLGIDFTETGFSSKPYYTDYRRDLVLDIFVNGNY